MSSELNVKDEESENDIDDEVCNMYPNSDDDSSDPSSDDSSICCVSIAFVKGTLFLFLFLDGSCLHAGN